MKRREGTQTSPSPDQFLLTVDLASCNHSCSGCLWAPGFLMFVLTRGCAAELKGRLACVPGLAPDLRHLVVRRLESLWVREERTAKCTVPEGMLTRAVGLGVGKVESPGLGQALQPGIRALPLPPRGPSVCYATSLSFGSSSANQRRISNSQLAWVWTND